MFVGLMLSSFKTLSIASVPTGNKKSENDSFKKFQVEVDCSNLFGGLKKGDL